MNDDPHLIANGRSVRATVLVGLAALALLVGVFGGWAAFTQISGAVVAGGRLVVDSEVKKVQHLTGGIVGQLLVREGDRVRRGDVLIRLDETVTRANLAILVKNLDMLAARRARLVAERDRAGTITHDADLLARIDDAAVRDAIAGEERLFQFRRELRAGRKAQLAERVAQLNQEIAGMETQRRAKQRQLELIGQEIERVRGLYQQRLIEVTRLIALQREETDILGLDGSLAAQIAQAHGKIAETELQVLSIDQETSEQVATELRDVDARIGEFVERRVAAEDQLKRTSIVAPQDGIVHQLAMHTVGGVVPTGEPVALIVPVGDSLSVEARVLPQDIDQLFPGQLAALRFSAFSQRTTPEIEGAVERLSADISVDPHSGLSYYTVRLRFSDRELARLGDVKLVPGMPVEAFIRTGDRSVASYFVKPLLDQIERAFRES